MLLVGDIGGTKTVIALAEPAAGAVKLAGERIFKSREHASLEAILRIFLDDAERPEVSAACFGVAGPVVAGRSRITNLPWEMDEGTLAAAIDGARRPRVKLLNDLEAAAYGMLFLEAHETRVLQPGADGEVHGNIAVVAAGTGLGEAQLYWDGFRHHPIASEAGHADLAARSDEDWELVRWLRARLGGEAAHVSWERVLSGPGFFSLYQFLRERSGVPEPAWLASRIAEVDPSAAVSESGLARTDEVCDWTIDLFMRLYGAEAGNAALRVMASGGVFIGGGIAPRMLAAFDRPHFLAAFRDKGRLSSFVEKVPVKVALNLRAPLLGAAHYAKRL